MTAIVLGFTGVGPTDQPPLMNYQKYFADSGVVKGIWKFDDPAALTMVSGKVASIANYIPGGPALAQATAANRATVAYDATLKRNVAVFSRAAGTNYVMASGAPAPGSPWTMLAVYKSAAQQFAILGQLGPDAWLGGGDPYLNGHIVGADIAASPLDLLGWNRHAVAYAGAGVIKLRAGDAPVVQATGGTAPTGSGFTLGHSNPAVAFGGSVDRVVLVASDLISDLTSPLSKTLFAYLKNRGV